MSDAATPRAGAIATASVAGPAEARAAVRQRWLVFGLCAATMFTEGYDAQFMGSVVPGISDDWGIPAGDLWPTLSAGLVGLMLGAFFIRLWPTITAAGGSSSIRSAYLAC